MLTYAAENPINRDLSYRKVVTRTLDFEIDSPDPFGHRLPDPGFHLTLPRGNVADYHDRMEWIENGMLGPYERLLQDRAAMRELIRTPVVDRAAEYRRLGALSYPP